jgi:hypothetical protein
MTMEEFKFENPLEITCADADNISSIQKEDKSSYMEDKLLEAHMEKCEQCREKKDHKDDAKD